MKVHNITDRVPGRTPQAYTLGQQTIRPGKYGDVDDRDITKKDRVLHGGPLWFGDLPLHLRAPRTQVVSGPTEAMTPVEIEAYLQGLEQSVLLGLCESVVPPMQFLNPPPVPVLATRLSRVIASGRVLDPEAFFWLRRWTKVDGQYMER